MNPTITPVDAASVEATAAEMARHVIPPDVIPAWGVAGLAPVGEPPTEMPGLAGADLTETVRLLRPEGLPADPAELTVLEGLWLQRQRRLTAQDWVAALLRRIEALEPSVQAWVTLMPAAARAEAARIDSGGSDPARHGGPLAGVPVGIKDIIHIRGVRTTGGSRSLADYVAGETAACVGRLEAAGAIMLGKATTVEFAVGTPAATRNPWHLEYTPGGSSSGSAAAVAARMVPAALGSQTGGSIIRPSAFCGVVGLKPTYGRVPVAGVIPLSWTMDHVGPITRTVADATLLFQALIGETRPRLPGVGVAGLRLGIPDRYFFTECEPEVAQAAHAALREFERMGANLVPVRLPATFEAARPANQLIMCAELYAYHRHAYAARPGDYGAETAGRIEAGRAVRAETYLLALQVRARFGADLLAAMDGVDLLATPPAPTPALRTLSSTGDPAFNSPFSLIGFPSLTVPAGFTAAGLPLGLQLVARPYNEAVLLTAGHTFQAATDWHLRGPAL